MLFFTCFPVEGFAEGICIKYSDGKLSSKSTTASSCPKKQAFIPALAGAQGEKGAMGEKGEKGDQGVQGTAGTNGSARAYGFVSSAGNINTALSSSNVAARKVATGVYCISAGNISPGTVMPVVSADQDDGTGNYRIVMVKSLFGNSFGCTASEWAIYTAHLVSSSFTTSDGAFSFIIP